MAIRSAPTVAAESRFAEYPFLPGAESLVAGLARTVGELLRDPVFERARALGRARIRAALDDPRGGTEIAELDAAEPEVRFLSFQFARILLSASPTAAPLRRWAVAEAKRAHARLRSARGELVAEVASDLGYDFRPEGGRIELPLVDYLKLATPIREAEFRLVRQPVEHGRLRLSPERASRLLQEGIRRQLSDPLPLDQEVVESVRVSEGEFLGEIASRTPAPMGRLPGQLRPAAFPPCIRRMRRALDGGENLSHAGRFALAAFLFRAGADTDTIVDAFRGAPDFDEGVTRYQVEHITSRDGGKGYEPPECATIRSHGLCVWDGDPTAPSPADRLPDRLCHEPWLTHPMKYYRTRAGGAGAPPAGGGAGASGTGGAAPGESAR
jgi:DNA primase large subunit